MKGAPETRTVLLVDDDPDSRVIYTTMLQLIGVRVVEATDGQGALQAACAHDPDLIVLDLVMPGMDGWTALEHLRSDPDLCHIPVVALTVIGPGEDRRDPLRRGFDAHWVKPLPPPAMAARVNSLLAGALAARRRPPEARGVAAWPPEPAGRRRLKVPQLPAGCDGSS
ncbi:MAG: response regulator [Gemmatimonadota bacterium]